MAGSRLAWGLTVLASACLSACQSEPSFDERFEKSESDIRAKASEMDQMLEKELEADTGKPSPDTTEDTQ